MPIQIKKEFVDSDADHFSLKQEDSKFLFYDDRGTVIMRFASKEDVQEFADYLLEIVNGDNV